MSIIVVDTIQAALVPPASKSFSCSSSCGYLETDQNQAGAAGASTSHDNGFQKICAVSLLPEVVGLIVSSSYQGSARPRWENHGKPVQVSEIHVLRELQLSGGLSVGLSSFLLAPKGLAFQGYPWPLAPVELALLSPTPVRDDSGPGACKGFKGATLWEVVLQK
jgi:hypothetical protein